MAAPANIPDPEGVLQTLAGTVREKATDAATKKLAEQNISHEIALKLLIPEYDPLKLRPDVLNQDVGVKSSIFERKYLKNNIQIAQSKDGNDYVNLNNPNYVELLMRKESSVLEMKICAPNFVFNKLTRTPDQVDNNVPHTNAPRPLVGSTVKHILSSYGWGTLPDVVCHRSMYPLRCIHSRKLVWSGTEMFDSTTDGIAELCWNIEMGLSGNSIPRSWWQKRLPSPLYENPTSKYAKYYMYRIKRDEFPGWADDDYRYDFRMSGLKIRIPFYVLQSPDLMYAGEYAQNRVQTTIRVDLGFVVGPYAFLSHNTEEFPFAEHSFVANDDDKSEYHMKRSDEVDKATLSGYLDKYLPCYFDTTRFTFYTPYNSSNHYTSVLGGPTVIGFDSSLTSKEKTYMRNPVGDANGFRKLSYASSYKNTGVFGVDPAMINVVETSLGEPIDLYGYYYKPKLIQPFRYSMNSSQGQFPRSTPGPSIAIVDHVNPVNGGTLLDEFGVYPDPVDWQGYLTRSKLLDVGTVSTYGDNGIYFKRPFQRAVVAPTVPAALPYRFSGEGGVDTTKQKLCFRMTAVMANEGGVQVDVMKKYIIVTADDDVGNMLPQGVDYSDECFLERELVNVDALGRRTMLVDRDSPLGMTATMWHSNDTKEGVFVLSPNERHTEITLNGNNNTLTYNYYFIHLTRYTKFDCKREHPLSLMDFDCVPFNQIMKEIIIKFIPPNSSGEQIIWKYADDPEMEIWYSFFLSYWKAFWPENDPPTKQTWLLKPVIIFSPNTRAGRPVRKFTTFTTGKVTVDFTYREGLSVNDFYSMFGDKYNFDFDPVIKPPHQVQTAAGINNNFRGPDDYKNGMYQNGTNVAVVAPDLTKCGKVVADAWLAPNAKREIQGNWVTFDFTMLNQMVSPLACRVVMTNTQSVWFAGVGQTGNVPCTLFVRSGTTGPSTTATGKK